MASTVAKAISSVKFAPLPSSLSHKYIDKRAHAYRERNAHKFKRVKFPNDTFIMLQPGIPVPADVVVFKVPLHYNKIMIKNYLEELYKIGVKKVNTAIYLGKTRINRHGFYYRRSDWKKAYVRLTEEFKHPGYKLHMAEQKPESR
jgi:ribosomal protein L23